MICEIFSMEFRMTEDVDRKINILTNHIDFQHLVVDHLSNKYALYCMDTEYPRLCTENYYFETTLYYSN